ncbi:MAG TPA: hypothetical protein VIK52_13565 [Opitutaceae bacterium]
MKRLLALVTLILSCTVAAAADLTFTSTLTPEERSAAGVDGLTPAQLARLDALVHRYKNAEVTREVEVAREETKQEARRRVMKEEALYVESRIVGEITGWKGGTMFRLENGEIWQQSNQESYYYGRVKNPKVVIKEAGLSGNWMFIEGFPPLRVRRIQ